MMRRRKYMTQGEQKDKVNIHLGHLQPWIHSQDQMNFFEVLFQNLSANNRRVSFFVK